MDTIRAIGFFLAMTFMFPAMYFWEWLNSDEYDQGDVRED